MLGQREKEGERERDREWGEELAEEKREGGEHCRYFDAKVIRHAWHYSWLGGGGRERERNRALDPNVTEADLMKWKVRNVAPATPACTGSAPALPQRANQELRGEG